MAVYKTKEAESKVTLGRIKGMIANKENKNKRISDYNKHPKVCEQCGRVIDYSKRRNKFCSHSCSAIYNNPMHTNRTSTTCLSCGKHLPNENKKYCSRVCASNHINKVNSLYIEDKFIAGKMNDVEARRYFRLTNKKQCSICLLDAWNGKDIPLEVDHVDGNTNNNIPSNLRFVCRNCGAQLPTSGSKNKYSGRIDKRTKWYYELMKEAKRV